MTLNIPASPTTLTAISKTGFGDPVRDSLLWLATDAPCCNVYNSANISTTSGSATALTFDSERFDVGGCHSTSTNTGRITVPTGAGGKWRFTATVAFASNSTGYRQVGIRLNGSTNLVFASLGAVNGAETIINVSCEYAMSAADYVEVLVLQNSGGALNVLTVDNYSPSFTGAWFRT